MTIQLKVSPPKPKTISLSIKPTIKPAPKIDITPPPVTTPQKVKVTIDLAKIEQRVAKELEKEILKKELKYPELATLLDAHGNVIYLDESQQKGVDMAVEGESFSVIGKAGTGKSTIVQAISLLWISRHRWEWIEYRIKGIGTKATAPSIAICAFTNQATDNIRNKLLVHPEIQKHFSYNVTTIHNLLEYTIDYTIDPETGEKKVRYYPQRDKYNKLEITHLVVEESSMVGVGDASLWQQLFDALPSRVQIVFLGDINQLPPVIGKSILSYALLQLPVTELTTVHRTALDNPIIRQALNCLEGKEIVEDYNKNTDQGVRIFSGNGKIKYCNNMFELAFEKVIKRQLDRGEYDPMQDMVLSPFFKQNDRAVSAQNLAKIIAGILAKRENRTVYEIVAGFQKLYLAVGDRILLDKMEGIVDRIEVNSLYSGRIPQPPSVNMDYFGRIRGNGKEGELGEEFDYSNLDIDKMLDEDSEERKRSASHIVHIKPVGYIENEGSTYVKNYTCSAVGDYATLTLGYALSVWKAQGSEWRNVIVALHKSNSQQLFRELLYTGITRARQRLDILAQLPDLNKARENQRIKGDNLEAKIEYFNGGYLDQHVDIIPGELS